MVCSTGKFPEKVENLKRQARFPGWNFRTKFRVPFTRFSYFIPVAIVCRQVTGPAPYWGLRSNGTTFHLSGNPFLFAPKFPDFLSKWKTPYHLTDNFGNSGWEVNGKVTFRKFQPKKCMSQDLKNGRLVPFKRTKTYVYKNLGY